MIRFNWEPQATAFVDLETQSPVDLKSEGGRRYAAHEDTRIAVCTMLVDNWLCVWVPRSVLPTNARLNVDTLRPEGFEGEVFASDSEMLPAEAHERMLGRTLVGHNSFGFDARVWSRCVPYADFEWFDTLPPARAAGLPGGLGELGERLVGVGKDPHGKQLIKLLSVAKVRNGKTVYPIGTEQIWNLFARYCARDTLLTKIVYHAVKPYVEPSFLRTHCAIAERGVPIDRTYCVQLLGVTMEHELKAKGRFKGITDVENPNSVQQVQAWLRSQGLELPSLERKQLETFFDDPESFVVGDDVDPDLAKVAEALRLRQSFARVGAGKVKTALMCADSDGRVRDKIVPYGAHTGRFTSYDLQLHNLAKGADEIKPENCMPPSLEAVEHEAERATAARREKDPKNKKPVSVGDVFAAMTRPMIADDVTGLSWSDYGAIEARMTAYMAGDQKLMALFRDPKKDPYIDFGSVIYGRPIQKGTIERWVSKQGTLGSLYQLSGPGLEARCLQDGVNICDAGTTGKEVVAAFRRTYHMIPVMWKELHDAVHNAIIYGRKTDTCRCVVSMNGSCLEIKLPSGRPIRYHGARMEDRTPGWVKWTGETGLKVPTACFDLPKGRVGILYGGRTTENVVQGNCADLLKDAATRTEDAGLDPVFHVHDELVCATEKLARLCEIMSTAPSWAPGFPILVEGAYNRYYAKKAPKGARECIAFRGEVIHGG